MSVRLPTRLLALVLAGLGQLFPAALPARGQDAQPTSAGAVVAATRQHAFLIPFRIEPARSPPQQPVEVQLNVSTNQGATWEVADRVKPDKGNFVYRAPHDGEYWYAIRTVDAQGVVRPEGHLQPQLKVLVDTVAPRLDLTATRGAAGEIVVRWQAVDPHLKPASFKLEYQPEPGGPWERVAVESPPSAMRHTTSGEATWWPKFPGGAVTVRGEIADSSGNPAMNQVVVQATPDASNDAASQTPGGSLAPAPLSTSTAGAPAEHGSAGAARWPADRSTSDPLGADGRAAAHGGDAQASPGRPPDPRKQTPTRVAAQPVAQTTRDPARPSPLDFSLLPAGDRPRMVGSRTFELEYEVESVGSSGIAKVELWGTLDGGRTWSVYGVDADNRSPLPVRVEQEGIYGFRIVVKSGNGLGGQPPVAGDAADVWIGVDLAPPVGRITAAEVSDRGDELVITWEAGDDMLEVRPVALEFAESPQGPWTPIASGLENSGSYTWRIDGRVPPLIYVRMHVRDEAGNAATFEWTNPVSLDRSRPEGRIRSVRPLGR
jgi:hypothetical protein